MRRVDASSDRDVRIYRPVYPTGNKHVTMSGVTTPAACPMQTCPVYHVHRFEPTDRFSTQARIVKAPATEKAADRRRSLQSESNQRLTLE